MNNPIQMLIDMFNTYGISPWLYGPLITGAWVLALLVAKKLVLRRLGQLAQLTPTRMDDFLVGEVISLPASIVIWGSAFALLGKLLPLDKDWLWLASVIFQTSLVLAVIVILDRVILKLLEIHSEKTAKLKLSGSILRGIVRGMILGLGALIFMDMIGVSITPIIASLGIGSLAVALGLQSTLSNLISGMQVMLGGTIRVGDFVKLASGDEGYVTEISWSRTRITTLPNNVIWVPNKEIIEGRLMNYHMPSKEIAVLVDVGVHYDSDLEKVERVTIETAREVLRGVKGAVENFDPFIRYHTFGSSSVNFTVILRAKEFTDQYLIKHEFVKALHKRYREEGVVIPYPIQTLDVSPQIVNRLQDIYRKD